MVPGCGGAAPHVYVFRLVPACGASAAPPLGNGWSGVRGGCGAAAARRAAITASASWRLLSKAAFLAASRASRVVPAAVVVVPALPRVEVLVAPQLGDRAEPLAVVLQQPQPGGVAHKVAQHDTTHGVGFPLLFPLPQRQRAHAHSAAGCVRQTTDRLQTRHDTALFI